MGYLMIALNKGVLSGITMPLDLATLWTQTWHLVSLALNERILAFCSGFALGAAALISDQMQVTGGGHESSHMVSLCMVDAIAGISDGGFQRDTFIASSQAWHTWPLSGSPESYGHCSSRHQWQLPQREK